MVPPGVVRTPPLVDTSAPRSPGPSAFTAAVATVRAVRQVDRRKRFDRPRAPAVEHGEVAGDQALDGLAPVVEDGHVDLDDVGDRSKARRLRGILSGRVQPQGAREKRRDGPRRRLHRFRGNYTDS